MAKFPGIRFRRKQTLASDNFGLDGNGALGIPFRASEAEWIAFRGGVDDVIYPGETRLISKPVQTAVIESETLVPPSRPGVYHSELIDVLWVCAEMDLEYEISAEGTASKSGTHRLSADAITINKQTR